MSSHVVVLVVYGSMIVGLHHRETEQRYQMKDNYVMKHASTLRGEGILTICILLSLIAHITLLHAKALSMIESRNRSQMPLHTLFHLFPFRSCFCRILVVFSQHISTALSATKCLDKAPHTPCLFKFHTPPQHLPRLVVLCTQLICSCKCEPRFRIIPSTPQLCQVAQQSICPITCSKSVKKLCLLG